MEQRHLILEEPLDGQDHALRYRRGEREEGCVDLMRVEVNTRCGNGFCEGIVRRAFESKPMCEILAVIRRECAQREGLTKS